MKQLSRHISYLLLTCRKVTIPGLGAFSAFYEPAWFDPEDDIFYPSRIRIVYDSEEDNQSFLLLNSLKRKLMIQDREAQEMIDQFVSEIGKKISRHHYCRLEGLGYLIENKGRLILKDTFWKHNKFYSISSLPSTSAQIS